MLAGSLALRAGLDFSGAWWVAALLAAMPALYAGGHSGFVDVIYATFILAAVRVGFDAEQRKHFALVGLFCGLAMGTKYTGLLALPVLLLCIAWPRRGSVNGEFLRRALIAATVACAVASPFYLRNWILLGSSNLSAPRGGHRRSSC
jgi:4-amino-4-deoxy-L-arabinose transferase-like glycosyltransferase